MQGPCLYHRRHILHYVLALLPMPMLPRPLLLLLPPLLPHLLPWRLSWRQAWPAEAFRNPPAFEARAMPGSRGRPARRWLKRASAAAYFVLEGRKINPDESTRALEPPERAWRPAAAIFDEEATTVKRRDEYEELARETSDDGAHRSAGWVSAVLSRCRVGRVSLLPCSPKRT